MVSEATPASCGCLVKLPTGAFKLDADIKQMILDGAIHHSSTNKPLIFHYVVVDVLTVPSQKCGMDFDAG